MFLPLTRPLVTMKGEPGSTLKRLAARDRSCNEGEEKQSKGALGPI